MGEAWGWVAKQEAGVQSCSALYFCVALSESLATRGLCGHIGVMTPFRVPGPGIEQGMPQMCPWASYDIGETGCKLGCHTSGPFQL